MVALLREHLRMLFWVPVGEEVQGGARGREKEVWRRRRGGGVLLALLGLGLGLGLVLYL